MAYRTSNIEYRDTGDTHDGPIKRNLQIENNKFTRQKQLKGPSYGN